MKTNLLLILSLLVFAGCAKAPAVVTQEEPKLAPWTIVCDRAGHWSFVTAKGEPYGVAYDTRQEAEDFMNWLKSPRTPTALDIDYGRRVKIARLAKWMPCEEPAAPKVETPRLTITSTTVADSIVTLTADSPRNVHFNDGWMVVRDSTMPSTDAKFLPETVTITVKREPVVTPKGTLWEITFKP